MFKYFTLGFSMLLFVACKDEKIKENKDERTPATVTKTWSTITQPRLGAMFTIGDTIPVSLGLIDSTVKVKIDSVQFFMDNKLLGSKKEPPYTYSWNSSGAMTGSRYFSTITHLNDGTSEMSNLFIILRSDIVPVTYTYKVVKTYPHDPLAYTQGLLYYNGQLYEGTGQQGQSSLRKVELQTGKIVQSVSLDAKYFGEGITLFNDKIIQLTWQTRVGFVYDRETFQVLQTFNYNYEGWGLTNNEKYLIMSDGSPTLHFLDPATFGEIRKIEVYDDKGPVNELNELEYINGEIYANIYHSDNIVKIDPETGKVTGIINLKGILKESDVKGQTDVLNGIAYHNQNKTLLVTGKWWPKLFEIKIDKR